MSNQQYQCLEGRYLDVPKAGADADNFCTVCPAGTFCPLGAVVPLKCPIGYYCLEGTPMDFDYFQASKCPDG